MDEPLERVRIFLADDHVELLAMAERLIGSEPEFEVIGTSANGDKVVDCVQQLKPDLLVLDITMPGMTGIEVARRLQPLHAKVVFLTVHDDPDYLRSGLAAGALGFVVKDRLATDLVLAIREALASRQFISPSAALEGLTGALK